MGVVSHGEKGVDDDGGHHGHILFLRDESRGQKMMDLEASRHQEGKKDSLWSCICMRDKGVETVVVLGQELFLISSFPVVIAQNFAHIFLPVLKRLIGDYSTIISDSRKL